MRKIYALGLHKTGSTSLQTFLLQHQRALAETGVFYPPVTPEGVARALAEAARRRRADAPTRLNEYMGHNALAYRLIADAVPGYRFPDVHAPMFGGRMALVLVREMARQMQAGTLIFCSEDLARAALMAPQTPALFAEHFGTDDVTLYCTIRRPDEAIASWQSQKLRFGEPFERLRAGGLGEYLGSVHFDYRAALAPWIACFPTARLILTPYAEQRAAGGAVAHFTAQCGLPGDLQHPPDSNIGLPLAVLDIARRAFHVLPRGDAVALHRYLAGLGARLPLPDNDRIELFGPALRAELADAFAPIHDWLGEISGRRPFFSDADDIARTRPLDDIAAAAAVLPDLLGDAETRLDNPAALAFLRNLQRDGPG